MGILDKIIAGGRVIGGAIELADAYFVEHDWTKKDGVWVSPDGVPVGEWLGGPEGSALAVRWLKSAASAAGIDIDRLSISIEALVERLRAISNTSGARGR
jgi:hypothetical protein